MAQFLVSVLFVECNHVAQVANLDVLLQPRQVGVQSDLEFMEQDLARRVAISASRRQLDGIDQFGSALFHDQQRIVDQFVDAAAESHRTSPNPDACAAQPVGIEKLGVILVQLAFACRGRLVTRVDTCQRSQQ